MARGYERQNDMAYGYRRAWGVEQSYHEGERKGIPGVDYGYEPDNIRDYNNDPGAFRNRFNTDFHRGRRRFRSWSVPGPVQRFDPRDHRTRRVTGPYQGFGPRGYRRPDESIQDDVNRLLARHGGINARDISVNVKDGEVTLKGTVHSRGEKRMAEDLIDSVSGVRDVQNQLKVSNRE